MNLDLSFILTFAFCIFLRNRILQYWCSLYVTAWTSRYADRGQRGNCANVIIDNNAIRHCHKFLDTLIKAVGTIYTHTDTNARTDIGDHPFLSCRRAGYGLRKSVPDSGQRGVALFRETGVRIGGIPDDHRDVSQPRRGQAIPRRHLHRH